jgi:D-serine deaminase-like pyridoxal phosphate-dependent protein
MDSSSLVSLDTPCLVVDLGVFESNVRTCLERLADVAVRPHMKTSKSPDVAKLLVAAGATGVCVAKLGEAEVMVEGGVSNLLITTELVGPTKVRRLARLLTQFPDVRVAVVVDSYEGARALGEGLTRPIPALIDVNVGQDRCGVLPIDARALADQVRTVTNLEVIGIQGYEGNLQHVRDPQERRALCDRSMARLGTAVKELRAGGHRVDVVTTGGTGTAEFCAAHEFVTEVQPGSFIFMDVDYGDTGGVPYRSALTALATVISRPTNDRVVVDAGLKTLSNDSGDARVIDPPGWTYEHAGDEHGILRRQSDVSDRTPLEVGARVTLIPSHIDTTVNLHDVIHLVRDGQLAGRWAIAARGKVQ